MSDEAQSDTPGERHAVKVREFYKDYQPTFDACTLTLRLIDAVPPIYLRQ